MDFFAQQDLARRNTRLLVLFFLAAVLLLVALTNAAVTAFLFFSQDYNIYGGSRAGLAGFLSYFSWARFGTIGLTVSSTVALVVLLKWLQLSTGGKAVAESMGGTRIVPQSRDDAERRCLNVVEEMALAANMPVPPVYVLNDERGHQCLRRRHHPRRRRGRGHPWHYRASEAPRITGRDRPRVQPYTQRGYAPQHTPGGHVKGHHLHRRYRSLPDARQQPGALRRQRSQRQRGQPCPCWAWRCGYWGGWADLPRGLSRRRSRGRKNTWRTPARCNSPAVQTA